MKAKRITNLICWAIVAIALIGYVCVEWSRQGCAWQSLVLAAAWYSILTAGLWYITDNAIRSTNN